MTSVRLFYVVHPLCLRMPPRAEHVTARLPLPHLLARLREVLPCVWPLEADGDIKDGPQKIASQRSPIHAMHIIFSHTNLSADLKSSF
jgi:hypothetical protein